MVSTKISIAPSTTVVDRNVLVLLPVFKGSSESRQGKAHPSPTYTCHSLFSVAASSITTIWKLINYRYPSSNEMTFPLRLLNIYISGYGEVRQYIGASGQT